MLATGTVLGRSTFHLQAVGSECTPSLQLDLMGRRGACPLEGTHAILSPPPGGESVLISHGAASPGTVGAAEGPW